VRPDRSARREVRNPLLALSAARVITHLPPEVQSSIAVLLEALACDARGRAELSWAKHKAPMAAYWKAVSVYARHLARLMRKPPDAAMARGPEREGEGALGRPCRLLLSGKRLPGDRPIG